MKNKDQYADPSSLLFKAFLVQKSRKKRKQSKSGDFNNSIWNDDGTINGDGVIYAEQNIIV